MTEESKGISLDAMIRAVGKGSIDNDQAILKLCGVLTEQVTQLKAQVAVLEQEVAALQSGHGRIH